EILGGEKTNEGRTNYRRCFKECGGILDRVGHPDDRRWIFFHPAAFRRRHRHIGFYRMAVGFWRSPLSGLLVRPQGFWKFRLEISRRGTLHLRRLLRYRQSDNWLGNTYVCSCGGLDR